MNGIRLLLRRSVAVVLGLVSLFFVFYTVRLLYVTHGLTVIRAGGNGTYLGALAFPILALAFGYAAWRLTRPPESRREQDSAEDN